MKIRHFFMSLTILLTLIICLTTCSDSKEAESQQQYTISVSPNGTVSVPANGKTMEFKITTNAERYGRAIGNVDWVSATFDSSKSYNCVIVTVEPNTSKTERRTAITFYAETAEGGSHVAEETVTLVQEGVPELPTTRISGTLDFGSNVSTTDYTVMTVLDAQLVANDNTFSATTIPSDNLPQPILVCNADGEVVMMAREPYGTGDTPKVDARSTALALVTMYPLFAPVKGASEFQTMKTMLLNASKWNAFEAQIAKTVRAGKPVLDPKNTAMIEALNDLMDEICLAKTVGPLTRADAPSQVLGRDGERPFKTVVSNQTVQFFNYSLTPMYEGVLYHSLSAEEEKSEPLARLDIPSGSDYGVTDIFFREGESHWTPAVSFDFSTLPDDAGEGKFIFHFTRTSNRAKVDFMVNFLGCCLDIIGAAYGTTGTKTWQQALRKFLLLRGMALTQLVMSGKWSKQELFEAVLKMKLAQCTICRAVASPDPRRESIS